LTSVDDGIYILQKVINRHLGYRVIASLFPSPLLASMYHSKFRALHLDNNSIARSTKDEDSANTLLHSAITLLQMGREGNCIHIMWPGTFLISFWSTEATVVHHLPHPASIIVDSPLGLGHNPFGSRRNLGQRIRTSIHRRSRNQKFVSFLISATMTAFGTVCTSTISSNVARCFKLYCRHIPRCRCSRHRHFP
jgi:hypothetical protein